MYQNPIEAWLEKKACEFTKNDIVRYFTENNLNKLNFRYIGDDGRLKALSFAITSKQHLEEVLSCGERVDGSSLFSYIESSSSDLYVIPKFRTAFLNPFEEEPTLELICSFYTNEGIPLPSAPENTMIRARDLLLKKTGLELEVMGELEFYITGEADELFPATDQKGYHEAAPFAKFRFIVEEAMQMVAEIGGQLKYGHSEVGNFRIGDTVYEQYELEFLPTEMEMSANHLIITKWILRNLGFKYGVSVSFAPKITVGKAGSGLHIHSRLMKDGKNVMAENGVLSDIAKKAIAGMLFLSPSLTAFGNTIPTSYLRLVPHQEAPTNICWGDRNRSVLVRVPLGWLGNADRMIKDANPNDNSDFDLFTDKQTVEFRCPDGSANIYLLFAGLAVAIRHGLEMDDSLDFAERNYVDVNIFKDEHKNVCKRLKQLPPSCYESAEQLINQIQYFVKYDVFSRAMLEAYAEKLKSYDDLGLSEKLFGKQQDIKALVEKYIHWA